MSPVQLPRPRNLSRRARTPRPSRRPAEVDAPTQELLREVAFILHATRRVKEALEDAGGVADAGQ